MYIYIYIHKLPRALVVAARRPGTPAIDYVATATVSFQLSLLSLLLLPSSSSLSFLSF